MTFLTNKSSDLAMMVRRGRRFESDTGLSHFQHRARVAVDSSVQRTRLVLVRADDLEALVDEDVVRPVDADVVDLVFAVAELHNPVDDAAWVGGQGS
jgi:hypothetical protein